MVSRDFLAGVRRNRGPKAFCKRHEVGAITFHLVGELLDQIVGERDTGIFSRQLIRRTLSGMLLEQGHRADLPLPHAFCAQGGVEILNGPFAIASNSFTC